MKYSRNQGSALVVVIIVFVTAIVGVLGYLVWNNFIAPKNNIQTTQTTDSAKTADNTPEAESNEGYLVLEDWGVKFKIPETLSSVKYYKLTAEPNAQGVTTYYEFSTQRVEDLGGQCAGDTDNGSVIRLDSLSRSQIKKEDFASSAPANNNEPIDGYYYVASGGQSTCADQGSDIQQQDRDLIYQMILNPVAL